MPATHMPGMAGESVTIFQLFSVSYIFLKCAFWTSETVYPRKTWEPNAEPFGVEQSQGVI